MKPARINSASYRQEVAHFSAVTADALIPYCTAIVLKALVVRRLNHTVKGVPCAATITVQGMSYTTPPVYAVKDEEDTFMLSTSSTPEALKAAEDGKIETPLSSTKSSRKVFSVYKLVFTNLNILFPGHLKQYQGESAANLVIPDHNEYRDGIHVLIHTCDPGSGSMSIGSTLCQRSSQYYSLSIPRGEVCLDFRVCPLTKEGKVADYPVGCRHSLAAAYLYPKSTHALNSLPPEEEKKAITDNNDNNNEAAPVEEQVKEEQQQEQEQEQAQEQAQEEEQAQEQAQEEEQENIAEETLQDAPAIEEEDALAVVETFSRPISARPRSATPRTGKVQLPCYTEEQCQEAFKRYDADGKGYLTKEELLEFCEDHVALFSCTINDGGRLVDDDDMLWRFISPYLSPPGARIPSLSRPTSAPSGATREANNGIVDTQETLGSTEDNVKVDPLLFSIIALGLARQ